MKLTFEGEDILKVCTEMERFLVDVMGARPRTLEQKLEKLEAPEQPKPKVDLHKNVAEKAAAAERMAKVRAAKAAKKKPEPAKPMISPEAIRDETVMRPEKFEDMVLEPDPIDEPEPAFVEPFDPTKLAALRVKTTEELQAAYSSGKHKQVLALLSKYGNGAKSFRELQIQDFIPLRKAIDDGALA